MRHAASATNKTTLRVGDAVRVRLGARDIDATVVEDRGTIGIGGRNLVRVRVELADEGLEFELPADEVSRTSINC